MKTRYVNNNVVSARDIAGDICEMFENLLDKYNIDIPDEDRENNEIDSHLYGMNYAICEDAITQLISDIVEDINKCDKDANITSSDSYTNAMGYMLDMEYYRF